MRLRDDKRTWNKMRKWDFMKDEMKPKETEGKNVLDEILKDEIRRLSLNKMMK